MVKTNFDWSRIFRAAIGFGIAIPLAYYIFILVHMSYVRGPFDPESQVIVILVTGLLLGFKKKNDLYILGNALSSMLYFSGVMAILHSSFDDYLYILIPYTLLKIFNLFKHIINSSKGRIHKKHKNIFIRKINQFEKKHFLSGTIFIIFICCLNIGLYVSINSILRYFYIFDKSSSISPIESTKYDLAISSLEGAAFFALAIISSFIFALFKNKIIARFKTINSV